jgi:hypothetical protein
MSSSLFASHRRIALAAAGMALVELAVGMATSAPSSANTLSENSPTQTTSVELASQSSGSSMLKEDDDKDDKAERDDQDEQDDDSIKLLSQSVTDAIFKEVSQKSGIEASKLRIVKVEQEDWSDGCLGLGGADVACNQAIVPGWRVIVASGEQSWVYRTDASGSLVKLDEVATRSITGSTTTQIIRREEVTTTRTTQTLPSVSTSSQRVQAAQSVTGSTTNQSRSSQSTQATGSSQMAQRTSSQSTQQQATLARSTAQLNFKDISQEYWAKDFIAELSQRGILTGFPDGKFHANEPVTRAQFAALLASVFKQTKTRNAVNFADVSTSHWAYQGIRDAYEMGLIEAVAGSRFNPNQSLTRLEIMTMLAKALNYSASNSVENVLKVYSDAVAIPAAARSLVAAATERGIVVNYPNVRTCNPNKVATRAEVAGFLYQALVSKGDATAISSPYVVTQAGATRTDDVREVDGKKPARQNCNQGIGNGAEGCDPGNSRPHGGSNDETGRTPGNRPKN